MSFGSPNVLQLPSEIITQIFTYLNCEDLLNIGNTCRHLYQLANDEHLWIALVQKCIPEKLPLTCPSFPTWKQAYLQLHPCWFLIKNHVWFSSTITNGDVAISRYNMQSNTIEIWDLRVYLSSRSQEVWKRDPNVILSRCSLYTRSNCEPPVVFPPIARLSKGVKIPQTQISDFDVVLARKLPIEAIGPGTDVWPHQKLPSKHRTRNQSESAFSGSGHRPQTFAQICPNAFRVQGPLIPRILNGLVGSHTMETWGCIEDYVLKPTKHHPLRGLWMGDYNEGGNGNELVAFIQPAHEDNLFYPSAAQIKMDQLQEEDDRSRISVQDEYADFQSENGNFQGCRFDGPLLAVKLTGDSHVPRGEYTFCVKSLGTKGLLRIADEIPFAGAHVVRAIGHIADRGFRNDEYISAQLFIISKDEVAMFWEGLGHISFFNRVNIAQYMASVP